MAGLADLSIEADKNSSAGRHIFDREGVLVVKGFFPPAIIQAAAAFLCASLEQVDALFNEYGFSLHDEDASARMAALVGQATSLPEIHKHTFLGHFPLEVRLAEALREIARVANARPLLFELLGTRRLFAHMPPAARYVLPHCSLAGVPPHQDISYNRHLGEFCVVWVPLVPIDEACGGMAVYRKTNTAKEILVDEAEPVTNGWLRPIESQDLANTERVVLAPLEPGDVVILGRSTVHESMPNNSGRIRLSCDFRFFGEQSHSTKHYLDLASDKIVSPRAAQD
ncbi:hypothetical protein BH11PSE3_BH11PSE3_03930 [soil metagenome]